MHHWNPSCNRAALVARSSLYHKIRQFFAVRQVLEVDTPILSQAAVCDPNIDPMQTLQGRWLQTSPEYPMKRLLCAGSGDIWQLCKVFRQGEAGQRHNPEFSMLEWYRVGWSYSQLMDEVAELVQALFQSMDALPIEHLTYQQAFLSYANLDIGVVEEAEIQALGIKLAGQDLALERDGWLDIIMSHQIEPALPKNTLVFIRDFPASQAALSKVITNEQGIEVAQRFELFFNGVELANGYQELTNAVEQRQRFEREAKGRPLDEQLLLAMKAGMPECAGVAIGVDRLLMHLLDAKQIADVLSFDWGKA